MQQQNIQLINDICKADSSKQTECHSKTPNTKYTMNINFISQVSLSDTVS